ncbi:MAG: GNAT family N-acetyltransferase [Alphaproteobacteria bacterium]|nr:GNAT family N-acetyltransferase [Alphaproteobacteria bacterium]
MIIRDAEPDDAIAIRAIVASAFGRSDEALLVDQLRADGDAFIELVAEDEADGDLLGHILFSPLAIDRPEGTVTALALAPVAARPDRQKQGIGAALIRAGIEQARFAAIPAIILVGHPGYYPRFGFSAKAAESLDAPFSGPSFMALELVPGVLEAGGSVRYAAAFGI